MAAMRYYVGVGAPASRALHMPTSNAARGWPSPIASPRSKKAWRAQLVLGFLHQALKTLPSMYAQLTLRPFESAAGMASTSSSASARRVLVAGALFRSGPAPRCSAQLLAGSTGYCRGPEPRRVSSPPRLALVATFFNIVASPMLASRARVPRANMQEALRRQSSAATAARVSASTGSRGGRRTKNFRKCRRAAGRPLAEEYSASRVPCSSAAILNHFFASGTKVSSPGLSTRPPRPWSRGLYDVSLNWRFAQATFPISPRATAATV